MSTREVSGTLIVDDQGNPIKFKGKDAVGYTGENYRFMEEREVEPSYLGRLKLVNDEPVSFIEDWPGTRIYRILKGFWIKE